jgi:dTDP-4-amino-4,6-dideoxygalactose transaminase
MPGIPFHVPFVAGDELRYLQEVVANRNFGGNGPFTKRCQELLEKRFGIGRVFLTHSCTAAMEITGLLLNLTPDDEVILPSFTFCTTASSFLRTGARLVFCEIDPATMMVDVEDIARKITNRTKTIVPVHYAGIASNLETLLPLAQKHSIDVVEDAAQCVGAFLNGKALGSFGRFGCVSFHETKNLHAGLAGALYVNNPADAERATYIWERGTDRQRLLNGQVDKYTWVELGSSFYPSELQAAFLLAQLEAMERNLEIRRALCLHYLRDLQPLADAGLIRLPRIDGGREHNGHAFFVTFNSATERERVREALKQAGIGAYFHYIPLHSSPMGQKMGYRAEDLPLTEDMAARLLRLPLHTEMSMKDVQAVCANLKACLA